MNPSAPARTRFPWTIAAAALATLVAAGARWRGAPPARDNRIPRPTRPPRSLRHPTTGTCARRSALTPRRPACASRSRRSTPPAPRRASGPCVSRPTSGDSASQSSCSSPSTASAWTGGWLPSPGSRPPWTKAQHGGRIRLSCRRAQGAGTTRWSRSGSAPWPTGSMPTTSGCTTTAPAAGPRAARADRHRAAGPTATSCSAPTAPTLWSWAPRTTRPATRRRATAAGRPSPRRWRRRTVRAVPTRTPGRRPWPRLPKGRCTRCAPCRRASPTAASWTRRGMLHRPPTTRRPVAATDWTAPPPASQPRWPRSTTPGASRASTPWRSPRTLPVSAPPINSSWR